MAANWCWQYYIIVCFSRYGCRCLSARQKVLINNAYLEIALLIPSRTTAFSQMQSAHLLAQFLFVPIGGALVSVDPWMPMWISTAFMMLGLIAAIIIIPETLPSRTKDLALSLRSSTSNAVVPNQSAWRGFLQKRLAGFFSIGRWIQVNTRVVIVLLCFVTYYLGQQAGGSLLLQYTAKRLGWSLGKVSYICSEPYNNNTNT